MNIVVSKAQKQLLAQGITSQAKGGYVKLVQKMCIFLVTILSSELAIIISAFYIWINSKLPPPVLDILGLTMGLSGSCIFNPVMFYLLNHELSDAFHKKYISKVHSFLHENRITSIVPFYHRHSKINSTNIDNIFTIKDWKFWFIDENLVKIFFEYGDKQCCMENLLFYQEITKLHELSQHLLDLMNPCPIKTKAPMSRNPSSQGIKNLHRNPNQSTILSISEINMKHNFPHSKSLTPLVLSREPSSNVADNMIEHDVSKVVDSWNTLCNQVICIYINYIEIPHSPLEINISDACRHNIILKLKSLQFDINTKQFPNISLLIVSEKLEMIRNISMLYNESLDCVSKIIESDIFPRFKKTTSYEKAVKNYEKFQL